MRRRQFCRASSIIELTLVKYYDYFPNMHQRHKSQDGNRHFQTVRFQRFFQRKSSRFITLCLSSNLRVYIGVHQLKLKIKWLLLYNFFLHTVFISTPLQTTGKRCHVPGGGGGALDFHVDGGGGVPLGVENLTLSQCARCTKYTPCHNIPC